MTQNTWHKEEALRVVSLIENNFSSEQLDLIQDMMMSLVTLANTGEVRWEIVMNTVQILARDGGLEV